MQNLDVMTLDGDALHVPPLNPVLDRQQHKFRVLEEAIFNLNVRFLLTHLLSSRIVSLAFFADVYFLSLSLSPSSRSSLARTLVG